MNAIRLSFLVLLIVLLAGAAEARGPYERGADVRFEGVVVDDLGKPLGGVMVVLAASRTREDAKIRDLFFGERQDGILDVLAKTDAQGRFHIDWTWDKHHDHFEAIVAAPGTGVDRPWHLLRQDVTERFNGESPVTVKLVVPASTELAWLRKFLDGTASADERRVFQQMGRPDRVDAGQTDYDPDSSWWYFAVGQVHRFRGGRLESVDHFEPVSPVD